MRDSELYSAEPTLMEDNALQVGVLHPDALEAVAELPVHGLSRLQGQRDSCGRVSMEAVATAWH
eukprot:1057049-Alexandrium_andersonii.AAC.1